MKVFIVNVLKIFIPKILKDKIKINLIRLYFRKHSNCPSNYLAAYDFMNKYGLTMIPSTFSLKYKDFYKRVNIYEDIDEMKYVIHNSRKLYFPRRMNKMEIAKLYQSLITEQDPESPHAYEYKDIRVKKGDVLLDIGAAEGIFTLDHIDELGHAYLFECDNEWNEALNKTFKEWKYKVDIISKYVSDENTDLSITIDEFVKQEKCEIDFIKMDIEGMEIKALNGAVKVLNSSHIKLSVCAYHNRNDAKEIMDLLLKAGYSIVKNNRLMYLGDYTSPFFRLGLVYAIK